MKIKNAVYTYHTESNKYDKNDENNINDANF